MEPDPTRPLLRATAALLLAGVGGFVLLAVLATAQLVHGWLGEPPMDPPYWPFAVIGGAMTLAAAAHVALLAWLTRLVEARLSLHGLSPWPARLTAEAAAWLSAFPLVLATDALRAPPEIAGALYGLLALAGGLAVGRWSEPATAADQPTLALLWVGRLSLWGGVSATGLRDAALTAAVWMVALAVELGIIRLRRDPSQRLVSALTLSGLLAVTGWAWLAGKV